jgi:hypothetical protein
MQQNPTNSVAGGSGGDRGEEGFFDVASAEPTTSNFQNLNFFYRNKLELTLMCTQRPPLIKCGLGLGGRERFSTPS